MSEDLDQEMLASAVEGVFAGTVPAFVAESNRIEGILRGPTEEEIKAHGFVLGSETLKPETIDWFVDVCTEGRGKLRRSKGMDVRVGPHLPSPGGPEVVAEFEHILRMVNQGRYTDPWGTHIEYETLHPFMDGNGRSGRVIWAWMMQKQGRDPFALPFLHAAYYQALQYGRGDG